MKIVGWLAASALALGLVACGGGGSVPVPGKPVSKNPENPVDLPVAKLIVQLDKTNVGNSEGEKVNVTVRAADEKNNLMPGTAVSVSVDGGAVLEPYPSKTDETGKLTAAILVGLQERSNRVVTVTVKSGTLSSTAKFDVIGAKLKATAVPKVVDPDSKALIIYQLTDVNGNPMTKQAIKVERSGALVSSGYTDINGGYTFSYTAPSQEGVVRFIASAGGVSMEEAVTVMKSGSNTIDAVPAGSIKSASVEANPSVVVMNTSSTSNQAAVRALFVGSDNKPIPNVRVRFEEVGATKYGVFTTGSTIVYSDRNGEATAAYIPGSRYSPTDGVTVRACYGYTDADLSGGACPNQTATTLTVVAEAISVTVGTNNKLISNLLTYGQDFVVQVVDSAGNAMPGVSIAASVDLLRFAKGEWFFNGEDKVWVRSATQDFRDSRPALTDPDTGFPVPNPDFGRAWYLEDPRTSEQQVLDPKGGPLINDKFAACWNEDRNRNGVREIEEDSLTKDGVVHYSKDFGGNGNGKLDPSKSDLAIKILTPDGKTDEKGQVTLRIEYPQNLASWLEYQILVSGKVGGTEGRATWIDTLGVPAEATKQEGEPPFVRSRYGVEGTRNGLSGCANPR